MDNYAISVQNVTKMYKLYDSNKDRLKEALGLTRQPRYREHYALHNLSFDVKRGETVGIIGTNGAGKSTILKIITGVLNPTEGQVVIDGRISALLELGAGFNQEYTGIENIYLNGTMMGFTREEIDGRLEDILKFADIGDFVYQPVKTYSSGMFVRLAFAVAINIDPEILIVDEALSVGDVFFQAKCYKKFEEFKKQGKTILFVSHDLGSIAKYCDRVILLDKGQKLDEGVPRDMVDLYKRVLATQAIPIAKQQDESVKEHAEELPDVVWKTNYEINPDVNEYGSGQAEIIDFAIIDHGGNFTTTIEKGTYFHIITKVKFHDNIPDPIFTYTIKDVQGTAISGTNTMYEKIENEAAQVGDVYTCDFYQKMDIQGGEYLLSISCTGFSDGDFQVYHRLYDVVHLTVVSEKNTVGFFDMNSEIKVTKLSR